MHILDSSIESQIIVFLSQGGAGTKALIGHLKKVRAGTTKQAVYRVIRKLNREEVLVVTRGFVSLNPLWVSSMKELFENVPSVNKAKSMKRGVLSLAEGDKVEYRFKDPSLTDLFWNDTMIKLVSELKHGDAIFLYNPHNWFLLARPESEAQIMKRVTQQGIIWHSIVGSQTPLDMYAQKYFDGRTRKYVTTSKPLFKKKNYYINVIGEYLIQVYLDEKVSRDIDSVYRINTKYNKKVTEMLSQIIRRTGRNRFIVIHSKKKADRLNKLFHKQFK